MLTKLTQRQNIFLYLILVSTVSEVKNSSIEHDNKII